MRGTESHVVIVHVGGQGPVEVARHPLTRPGVPAIIDAHFPPASAGALERVIRPKNTGEEEFLVLGAGAALWLKEAAAAGTNKIRHKMERAATLAKVMGRDVVDQGLGAAAVHHRFTHEDLVSIITNTATGGPAGTINNTRHSVSDQGQWLSQGTGGWANFGTNTANTTNTADGSDTTDGGDATDLEGATE